MKAFLLLIAALLLGAGLWLIMRDPEPQLAGDLATGTQTAAATSQAGSADLQSAGAQAGNSELSEPDPRRATNRFSGRQNQDSDTADDSSRSAATNNQELTIAESFRQADDLGVLYTTLLESGDPEDLYYRFRILKECNDVRINGIEQQLNNCESIAEHTARGQAGSSTIDSSIAISEIADRCFSMAERCGSLDFDSIEETPGQVLQQAIDQGSPLARAANLYQLSKDDPAASREWLAAALSEQPDAELIRHANSFLRSSYRFRDQPYYGVTDADSLQTAEYALDLLACRMEQGCPAGSLYMLERCNYLQGCSPWQSYEQWLFESNAGNPDRLNAILQLSQDYQFLLQNGNGAALLFPELTESDGG